MKLNGVVVLLFFGFLFGGDIDLKLEIAGKNKKEIKRAIRKVPRQQRAGMEWLINHMP